MTALIVSIVYVLVTVIISFPFLVVKELFGFETAVIVALVVLIIEVRTDTKGQP